LFFSLLVVALGAYIVNARTLAGGLRWAWLLWLLACLAAVVSEAPAVLDALAGRVTAFPTAAEVIGVAAYPLFCAGLFALPYAPLKRDQRQVLAVDIAIVVTVTAVGFWQLLGAPLLAAWQTPGADHGWVLAVAAYPLGDLLLVAGLVALVQQEVPGIDRRVVLVVAGALVLLIVADTVRATGLAYDRPVAPAALNLARLTARWALLVAAAWQIRQGQRDEPPPRSFTPLLSTNLLYIVVAVIIAFAIIAMFAVVRANPVLAVTLAGSRLLTFMVVLRQFFVLRENRRLTKALEQLATTDGLTGLANRRTFDETVAREIIRAQRYQRPFSLLLIDVDDFKRLNDERGHVEGDRVLKTLASLIRAQLRASDFAARFGGDEFVVILPESDATVARNVAEKLDAAISGILGLEGGPSVSIGRAGFQPKMTAIMLLEAADQDMYRAKAARGPAAVEEKHE
jgi:diguanylate cyclase (GGDEF)-like protein